MTAEEILANRDSHLIHIICLTQLRWQDKKNRAGWYCKGEQCRRFVSDNIEIGVCPDPFDLFGVDWRPLP